MCAFGVCSYDIDIVMEPLRLVYAPPFIFTALLLHFYILRAFVGNICIIVNYCVFALFHIACVILLEQLFCWLGICYT